MLNTSRQFHVFSAEIIFTDPYSHSPFSRCESAHRQLGPCRSHVASLWDLVMCDPVTPPQPRDSWWRGRKSCSVRRTAIWRLWESIIRSRHQRKSCQLQTSSSTLLVPQKNQKNTNGCTDVTPNERINGLCIPYQHSRILNVFLAHKHTQQKTHVGTHRYFINKPF